MELLPFQKEAVQKMLDFLWNPPHGVYNACEMGLGKTVQAIAVVNELQSNSLCIVCPAVMCLVWRQELFKWGYSGQKFIVRSYGKASECCGEDWDALILDEAHYIKNPRAERTKMVLKHLWPNAKYKICLSGTPFTQSIMDCHTIFSRLAPDLFSDWFKFAYRYTHVKRTPWGDKYEGVRNAAELSKLIRERFFVRYTKKEVLRELPPKRFQAIPLPKECAVKLTDEEAAAMEVYYKELELCFVKLSKGNPVWQPPKVPVHGATIRQKEGLKKVKYVADFCKEVLDNGESLVVFAWHRSVLRHLEDALVKYSPVVLTGDTSEKDRMEGITAFQEGKTKLFIGQMAAAGIGITLTAASKVCLADIDWNPSTVSQAINRLHRIGQKESVMVYTFPVEGSKEAEVMETMLSKIKTFEKVLA